MTQGGGCACGPRGPHRADFPLGIVHDDAINEECHQWSALSQGQMVAGWLPALAKRLNALGQGRHIDRRLGLGIAWPPWRSQALLGLGHRLTSARKLLPREHLCQGEIAQPRWVAFQLRQDVTQRVASRWQGLGHPCAHLGPRPCMGEQAGVPQAPTEVLPAEVLQGRRWGIAGRAARALVPAAGQRGGHDRRNKGSQGSRGGRRMRADTDHH